MLAYGLVRLNRSIFYLRNEYDTINTVVNDVDLVKNNKNLAPNLTKCSKTDELEDDFDPAGAFDIKVVNYYRYYPHHTKKLKKLIDFVY